MKKLITIVLVIAILLSLSGCANINSLPKKEEDPYPAMPENNGYTVTGIFTDSFGNPLPNAVITSEGKVRGITNKDGVYKITGLSGSVKLVPSFMDYTFNNKEIIVNGGGEQNFVGKNNYTVSANVRFDNGSMFYQSAFLIGGKVYASDNYGMFYLDNRNGKITITPYSNSFDFEPASVDVYTSDSAIFVAKPKKDTINVSGKIDLSKLNEKEGIPQLYVAVDGKRYTDVIVSYDYDWEKEKEIVNMTYQVLGLPQKAEGYTISLIDNYGNQSAQSFKVTESVENLNFEYKLTRSFDIKLIATNKDSVTGYNPRKLDYAILVKDEQGNLVKKYYGDEEKTEGVAVWAGCKVHIEGEYYDRTQSPAIHLMFEDWIVISNAMMRDMETTEYEITFRLLPYVEPEEWECVGK